MRLTVGIALFFLSIVAIAAPARAQVITAGPDSVIVSTTPDTATAEDNRFFLSKWDRPAKAALFSAIVPGFGQAYNKAYWKMPIVYATGGVLAYFWIDNHTKYKDFEEALLIRRDGGVDKYANSNKYGTNRPDNGIPYLKYARDYYRRNRDLTILLSIGAYGLQIAEAYVHAHMKEFDISDELALKVQPNIMRIPTQQAYTPGLSLTLYTRSK